MRHPGAGKNKDRSTVIYNPHITVRDIPEAAWDYVVNGKPALAWVMERQCVRTDKASGIVSDANRYATETVGNPRYPLDLFLRVITVSLETMKIVKGPARPGDRVKNDKTILTNAAQEYADTPKTRPSGTYWTNLSEKAALPDGGGDQPTPTRNHDMKTIQAICLAIISASAYAQPIQAWLTESAFTREVIDYMMKPCADDEIDEILELIWEDNEKRSMLIESISADMSYPLRIISKRKIRI